MVIYFLWIPSIESEVVAIGLEGDWIESRRPQLMSSTDIEPWTLITHHLLPMRLVHLFIPPLWFAALLAAVVFLFQREQTKNKTVVFNFVLGTPSYLARETNLLFLDISSTCIVEGVLLLGDTNVCLTTQSDTEYFGDFAHRCPFQICGKITLMQTSLSPTATILRKHRCPISNHFVLI